MKHVHNIIQIMTKGLSQQVRSTDAASCGLNLCGEDLAPQMHNMHDLKREKEIRHLSQPAVEL